MTGSISILIITYNRPDDLLELLESISTQQLAALKEILILNNASTVPYTGAEAFIQQHPELKIQYILSGENLGVARGRNKLMTMAAGEWLLVIDDDMIFPETDDLQRMAGVTEKSFFKDANAAVISVRVIYYETRELQQTAFPHKRYALFKDQPVFLTSYFPGGAHLIRREVLAKTGLYPVDFFYGMEEYDLAYRIVGAGYSIGYDNSVTLVHKESPKGRQPNHTRMASLWINKSKVAWRYLPRRYYVSTMLMWSLEYIRKTKGHWGTWFASWPKVWRICLTEKRHPIDKTALGYLKKVKARLWY